MNGLSFKTECSDCKNSFEVTKDKVVFNQPFKAKDGQTIFLTYYVCPECGRRHYSQIDDKTTSELRKETSKVGAKLFAISSKGKQVPRKQKEKFDREQRRLTLLRTQLVKKYEGETVTDTETGEEVNLHIELPGE